MQPTHSLPPVRFEILKGLTDYETALAKMDRLVSDIHAGKAQETILLLEHPPLFTAGTSAKDADLLSKDRFPVYETGRGGEYTYHGPGQRVAYVMLDLNMRTKDIRAFVYALEKWIIQTLAEFSVKGERRTGRVGVWVERPEKKSAIPGLIREDKIAAVGIRMRKWISLHGISINVEPDLKHYDSIVPCGIKEHGVTSLVDLGLPITMEDLDLALLKCFEPIFGKSIKAYKNQG